MKRIGKTWAHDSHFALDFAPGVRKALLRRGIEIIGAVAVPDMSHQMPYANASRGYQLDDNGTHRIRSRVEVIALAVAPLAAE